MDEWLQVTIGFLVALVVGFLGWQGGVSTVMRDCEVTGVFYVQSKVYDCKLKEKT